MPARGKFIALEGIDGSGKRTQLELLSRALKKRGIDHVCVSFPHYAGFFGKLVARYLNGEFGRLAEVDPHFSALLYAGDRLENREKLEVQLERGKHVLADRYIASNLAHQGARVAHAKAGRFLKWIEELEYDIYELPREDLVIYLRVPAEKAHEMVGGKGARSYTKRRRDLQEANLAHLKGAAGIYDRLSKRANWRRIECVSAGRRQLLPVEAIHREVIEAVGRKLRIAGLRASREK